MLFIFIVFDKKYYNPILFTNKYALLHVNLIKIDMKGNKGNFFLLVSLIAVIPITLVLLYYQEFSHSTTNVHSIQELEQYNTEQHKLIKDIDLTDNSVLKREIDRIKRLRNIEVPTNHYAIAEEEKGKRIRNLNELNGAYNEFTSPVAIINFREQTEYNQMRNMYRFILQQIKLYSSKFILYPYAFNYNYELNDTEKTKKTIEYPEGAMFSLDNKSIYVPYVMSNSTIQFKKARALYDTDIAILRFTTLYEEFLNNLFYDADSFTTHFFINMNKPSPIKDTFKEYQDYKKSNPGKSAIAFIDHNEIKSGALIDEYGQPRFGVVVIPDHILGTDKMISSLLGEDGRNKIKQYVNAGGNIIVTGKSGFLLEHFDLIPQGTYNTSFLLSTDKVSKEVTFTGCENSVNKTYESNNDFLYQTICSNYKGAKAYAASTYPMVKGNKAGLRVIASIDSQDEDLIYSDVEYGIPRPLTEEEKSFLPLFLYKKYGKGSMMIINGNPFYIQNNGPLFNNAFLYAISKPMYLTSRVKMGDTTEDVPIPAGEAGVHLDIEVVYFNLDDKEVKNFDLHIYLPRKVEYSNYDKTICQPSDKDVPEMASIIGSLNKTTHLLCHLDTISPFEKKVFMFNIEIEDYTVTQQKYNILLLYPFAFFVDSGNNVRHILDNGGVKTDADLAAVLRGAMNPDPSSFYPLPGAGTYVDNVIKVENKENTAALDVDYVGIIPIVSPVTDISDQGATAYTAKLYYSYYKDNGYKLPLLADDDYDYLDVKYLNDKDVLMVAEWDNPVKPNKELRDSKFPVVDNPNQNINIKGINYAVSVNSTNDVVKQINFRKADRFYMHATQRLLAFIDSHGAKGAKALYNGNIPPEWIDPIDNTVTKKQVVFARLDLFFYDNENYQLPNGTNSSFLFTLDHYPNKPQKPCVERFGDAQAEVMVKGYFDHTKDGGLKPNEYSNPMLTYCNRVVVDPTNLTQIEEATNHSGTLIPTHYMIPVKDSSIKRAGQLYGFVENEDKVSGYFEEYPSIKLVRTYSLKMRVKPNITRQGGKIEIMLPSNVKVKDKQDITFSPDQIAFYETEYDENKHTITGYFKRGLLPNEAYGKDSIIDVNIENTGLTIDSFETSVNIYEVKFDISSPQTQFETYFLRQTTKETFKHSLYYSFPALEVRARLNRLNDTTMRPYETLEPFTRYGLYIQEIVGHRTLWGSAESHHQSDPGMQAINDGFSVISNIGISSIPFVEYVTTGAGLVIPATPTTSRIEWRDVWNRKWSQPLRTVFPDVAPIPPPLKNFMMSTTFEMIQKDSKGKVVRLLEWPSDEEAQIRIHIKLLNNYQKYFEITRCNENEIDFIPSRVGERHDRIFDNSSITFQNVTKDNITDNQFYLSTGGFAKYANCFLEEGTVISGQKLNDTIREMIINVSLCADSTDEKQIAKCAEQYKDIPTVTKRKVSAETCPTWIYSPRVERYYPHNYIKDNMWDLTHIDYDDNAMDKAYKYHLDNNLPNIDMPSIKPSNVIMQPIFKGLGYDVQYNKNTNYLRGKYHGWWSDNLQNKDHTLVAGQKESNDVSVDKESTLQWINVRQLKSIYPEQYKGIYEGRLKNIYACLFNQHRVKVDINNPITTYLGNVNQNNIVPIIPNLDIDDPRLVNYDCSEDIKQYTPENIYLEENVVETPTDKDYLYFAANLRGEAKETINVLATIKPIPQTKYEGVVKVNEGGRFVYWNPANGPNSYLIVDNPVNIVQGKRNDPSITMNKVLPTSTTTFKAMTYQLFTVEDPSKLNKEWPFKTYYINSYGFGDSAVTVYIGGVRKSNSVLQPGETTYARVTFYNNAGFDWNLKYEAIDFVDKPGKPGSAYDLLNSLKSTVQVPTKYNFMKVTLPKGYEQYITVEPSDHNVDVAPEFFDFGSINVATIRDGFKGDYYYKITVSPSLPAELRGKPISIGLDLVEDMFDALPSYNDPTKAGYHDYHVQIPSLMIGVPYKDGAYAGKVLYTPSYATDLKLFYKQPIEWEIKGIKYVTDEQISQFTDAAIKENRTSELQAVWDSVPESKITYTSTPESNQNKIYVDFSNDFSQFPKPNGYQPDIAKFSFIIQTYSEVLGYGNKKINNEPKLYYSNWVKKEKNVRGPDSQTVFAKGAWLTMRYTSKIQIEDNGEYVDNIDQRLFPTDNGTLKIFFTMQNDGNENCYNTNFTLLIEPNVTLREDLLTKKMKTSVTKNEKGQTVLTFFYGKAIMEGERYSEVIYLDYHAIIDTNRTNGTNYTMNDCPEALPLISNADASIDLTNQTGEAQVKESYKQLYTFPYTPYDREVVAMELKATKARRNPHIHLNITANPNVTKSGYKLKYQFFKKYLNSKEPVWVNLTNASDIIEVEDDPVQTATNVTFNGTVKVIYKIVTYNELKEIVSYTMLMYDSSTIGLSMIDYIACGIGLVLLVASGVVFGLFFYLTKKYAKFDNDEVEVRGQVVKGTVKAPLIQENPYSIN